MKQKFIFASLLLVLSLCVLSLLPAKNTTAKEDPVLPEQAGIYAVPGNPKLKLRVIVHPVKQNSPAKPQPVPTVPPALDCNLGLTDDNSSTIPAGLTDWHLKSGFITYNLNKNSVPSSVGSINFSTIAKNSFDTWSTNTEVKDKVTFQEGPTVNISKAVFDSRNIITWGRTSPSALAVAYTWYNPTTGEVVEVDTIFNNKYPWAWSGGNNLCAVNGYYDAQNILTHELGHWMGLNDAYDGSFTNHTMYGYGSINEVKKNTLTQGDMTAVNSIY